MAVCRAPPDTRPRAARNSRRTRLVCRRMSAVSPSRGARVIPSSDSIKSATAARVTAARSILEQQARRCRLWTSSLSAMQCMASSLHSLNRSSLPSDGFAAVLLAAVPRMGPRSRLRGPDGVSLLHGAASPYIWSQEFMSSHLPICSEDTTQTEIHRNYRNIRRTL
eukprot:6198225-Pleurochrysis_carterae.AAC.2